MDAACGPAFLYCLFAWTNPFNPGGATNKEANYPHEGMCA